MCIGVEAYNAAVTFTALTVVPDVLGCIAQKYLPPKDYPPLSSRGIFISTLSIGYYIYSRGEWIALPACIYGIIEQSIALYEMGKKIWPDLKVYLEENKEIQAQLDEIKAGMDELNQKNISVRRFRLRYNRVLERFNQLDFRDNAEVLKIVSALFQEFQIYKNQHLRAC